MKFCEFLRMIQDYLKKYKNKECVSRTFIYDFIQRNRDSLSFRKPTNINKTQLNALNPIPIQDFFFRLINDNKLICKTFCEDDSSEEFEVKFSQIVYNFDETGGKLQFPNTRVIAPIGLKNVKTITDTSKYQLFSLGVCGSASGSMLSPFIIFKCYRIDPKWVELFPEAKFCVSLSGYMTSDLFELWLTQLFIPQSNEKRPPNYEGE